MRTRPTSAGAGSMSCATSTRSENRPLRDPRIEPKTSKEHVCGRSSEEAHPAGRTGRAAQPPSAESDDARALPAVQEPQATASSVSALWHVPRPPGHPDQGEADRIASAVPE